MTGPQVENGYTRIANELLDALVRTRIPGEARQVFDAIMRKTYGFQKKIDVISITQLSVMTGLKRPTVVRALNKLLIMNAVIKKDNSGSVSYGINKHFNEWKMLSKKIPPLSKKIMGVIKKDNLLLSKKINTKEILKKSKDKEITTLAHFAQFWSIYPKKKSKGQAEKAFLKLNPSPDLLQIMLEKIEALKQTEDWTKQNGKFIPYPATWLRAKGWEDEITADNRYSGIQDWLENKKT